jgi:hypothetical protein
MWETLLHNATGFCRKWHFPLEITALKSGKMVKFLKKTFNKGGSGLMSAPRGVLALNLMHPISRIRVLEVRVVVINYPFLILHRIIYRAMIRRKGPLTEVAA